MIVGDMILRNARLFGEREAIVFEGRRLTFRMFAERATRLWLALAVATLWLVSVGGEAEAEIELTTVPELLAVKRRQSGTRWRTTGVFQPQSDGRLSSAPALGPVRHD